jgi:hypothetical protein
LASARKRAKRNGRTSGLVAAEHATQTTQATERLPGLARDVAGVSLPAQDAVELRRNGRRELVFEKANDGLRRLASLILADSCPLRYLVHQFVHAWSLLSAERKSPHRTQGCAALRTARHTPHIALRCKTPGSI